MPIPPRGSIPKRAGRKSDSEIGLGNLLGGMSGLFEGLLKSVGKTVESVQNLNLEDLEKLAEAQGNKEAKENIRELKEKLGKLEEKGIRISDLFKEGFDLSKLIDFAAKHGGEFSQEFAGGKGMAQVGIRGRGLGGLRFGGGLPLERRGGPQETKFDVKGIRRERTVKTKKVEAPADVGVHEPDIDPIEEDQNSLKVRGYMAGVDEQDIFCEVKENGTVLRISTRGQRRYEKEVELPAPVIKRANWTYKNGVLEITLKKSGSTKRA